MSISLKTHKLLWGRSGNRCAFQTCRKELVVDATETDDPSIIGEEAHIYSKSPLGPDRVDGTNSVELDTYDNLILLCRIHHKVVDDQPLKYDSQTLRKYKEEHEKWVKEQLSFDETKQFEELVISDYIDKFINMVQLHNWNNWTSWVTSGSGFPSEIYEKLEKVPNYLVSRIWPDQYMELKNSLLNFKEVLNDLFLVFNKYLAERKRDNEPYRTEKFYKIREFEQEEYYRLLKKYEYHEALLQDLILELTRAANYICDKIRKSILRSFRIEEGALLVSIGPMTDLSFKTYRVEYRKDERIDFPYPGLEKFMEIREQRDLNFGKGYDDSYIYKPPFD